MPNNTTALQLLKDAREFLRDEGRWAQHRLYDALSGRCCALGAVVYAYDPALLDGLVYPDTIRSSLAPWCAEKFLNNAAYELGTKYGRNRVASSFNDHPETTHAQVLEMFDRAIELAEREAA